MKRLVIILLLGLMVHTVSANELLREKLLMNFNWKFSYGHPFDAAKDHGHGTGYFSYYAKAGYGDGPAAANFDDRAWRELDLPHDFAVEQPFDAKGSHSHGYKAIGRNFPEVSVGWYRKSFEVPAEDLGRRISVIFDGVHRNAKVFINGHLLGFEESGYNSFTYDLTAYLNYGGHNVLSVRVDVTDEEGWYYEGAGIYRHVWLRKTNPVHVAHNGTFVYAELKDAHAVLTVETEVQNDELKPVACQVKQQLLNHEGKVVAESESAALNLSAKSKNMLKQQFTLEQPRLWSVDDPYLYQVKTIVSHEGKTIDEYLTRTGIRSIRFDAEKGFFLNGKALKLKGTNNHQDHAGVGTAIPDELQRFRLQKLKDMGSNAIRSSHNPATPALLEACDEMGILVINENRLMGTAPFIKDQLERLMKRDRNHPSIIIWSLGNEEWAIEGNVVGERIIADMQAFANKFDHTRPKNAASSGGWGNGISKHIELMGFNYLGNGNSDEYHARFPHIPSAGTEEGSTNTTRGVYFDDPEKHHIAAYDRTAQNGHFKTIEYTWKHYAARDFLSGMFIWTGFDYRGEPTPYGWPSIHSYFGMYDVCGFPKDNVWYLKAWWGSEPVLHLFPHWNWAGREGETIKVVAYSNLDEVELIVNKKSAGRKTMETNSHIEWLVPYKAGEIKAIGYKNGKKFMTRVIETTGNPQSIVLEAHKATLMADNEDLAIISVSVNDDKGRLVPTAGNLIHFELEGPGKIIGVGNGDNTCLEPDKYIEAVKALPLENIRAKIVTDFNDPDALALLKVDQDWKPYRQVQNEIKQAGAVVYNATLQLPDFNEASKISFLYNCIGDKQVLYLNGKAISGELHKKDGERYRFEFDHSLLKPGNNELTIVATPYTVRNSWDSPNTNPGVVQVINPAPKYQRSLFNGYAQVIVQTSREAGNIRFTAKSEGLKDGVIMLNVAESKGRPHVE